MYLEFWWGIFLILEEREINWGIILRCALENLDVWMGDDGARPVVGFGFGDAVVCLKCLVVM
jgi:hypothetical protein